MVAPPWIRPHEPVVRAVVALFSPHVEVVAHDVTRDRIAAIWNPVSGRTVGDRSLLEPELIKAAVDGTVYGPYAKVDRRGTRWTSVSIPLADGAGLLCFNFDRSRLDSAAALLAGFAAPLEAKPPALFERDWRDDVNGLVDDWCRSREVARSRLTPDHRREIVQLLDDKGIFQIRNSAEHVAATLGVSRATVYSVLKSVREGKQTPAAPPAPARPRKKDL